MEALAPQQLYQTHHLTESRYQELQRCMRDDLIPTAREGYSKPIAIRIRVPENQMGQSIDMGALGIGAVASMGQRDQKKPYKTSRRRLLQLSGGALLIAGAATQQGCPLTRREVEVILYLSIKLFKTVYELYENICSSVLIENPNEVALENQGYVVGLGMEDLTRDKLLAAQNDPNNLLDSTVNTIIDIPAAKEVILDVCGVYAEYPAIFKLGGLLWEEAFTSESFEVVE